MNTALYIASLNTVSQIDWYWQWSGGGLGQRKSSAVHELFAGIIAFNAFFHVIEFIVP